MVAGQIATLQQCPCCGSCTEQPIMLTRFMDYLRHVGREDLPAINDGYRCAAHNAAFSSDRNNPHVRGLAFHQPVKSDKQRYIAMRAAYAAGFIRIGDGGDYLHIDCDGSLQWPVHYIIKRS